ncbi:MAG: VCBS repeat-containing protein [Deltaproteobacteria bacterium]|nr:VCBS repeat-containing protein [Deltaproteobacteria bacterium]
MRTLCTALVATLSFASSCTPAPAPPPLVKEPSAAPAPAAPTFPSPKTLLLAQAQFVWEDGADGKRSVKPGPAKLVMLAPGTPTWKVEVLQDEDSRVLHKAVCVTDAGASRLLTIGGTGAYLKLWRVEGGAWTSTALWQATFGGKWDRLRDFEIGDVDGDGKRELVIGTHDQGVVAVLARAGSGWRAREIYREPDTFIHEVELGDVDGDGVLEIFVTPSKPNKAEASQSGNILGFDYVAARKTYRREVVAKLGRSHAKEILATDLDGDGKDELYAAVEAVRGDKGEEASPVEVRQLERGRQGEWRAKTLASLPGAVQARVLLAADLTGSGKRELVISTMKAGVWRLRPPAAKGKGWDKLLVDDSATGFENAAGAADLDGDGKPELYVAADDQDEVVRLTWNGHGFDRSVIFGLEKSDLTWTILPCVPEDL